MLDRIFHGQIATSGGLMRTLAVLAGLPLLVSAGALGAWVGWLVGGQLPAIALMLAAMLLAARRWARRLNYWDGTSSTR